jgi:hypothetical protein
MADDFDQLAPGCRDAAFPIGVQAQSFLGRTEEPDAGIADGLNELARCVGRRVVGND